MDETPWQVFVFPPFGPPSASLSLKNTHSLSIGLWVAQSDVGEKIVNMAYKGSYLQDKNNVQLVESWLPRFENTPIVDIYNGHIEIGPIKDQLIYFPYQVLICALDNYFDRFQGLGKIKFGDGQDCLCRCFAVGKSYLRSYLSETPELTLRKAMEDTFASAGCGLCRKDLLKMIELETTKRDGFDEKLGISIIEAKGQRADNSSYEEVGGMSPFALGQWVISQFEKTTQKKFPWKISRIWDNKIYLEAKGINEFEMGEIDNFAKLASDELGTRIDFVISK